MLKVWKLPNRNTKYQPFKGRIKRNHSGWKGPFISLFSECLRSRPNILQKLNSTQNERIIEYEAQTDIEGERDSRSEKITKLSLMLSFIHIFFGVDALVCIYLSIFTWLEFHFINSTSFWEAFFSSLLIPMFTSKH